jgi:uncharacterized protein (DUF169 family)
MSSERKMFREFTRRDFVAGAAVAGAAAARSTGLADLAQAKSAQTGGQAHPSLGIFNAYGTDLEKMVLLRTYPIAIKMLKSESEIPKGAVRPKKDRGEHYAACQAFAAVRRQGITLAMFLEDHWCFEPIISYGLVETPQDYLDGSASAFFIKNKEAAKKRGAEMTRLPFGKYAGMVIGPLRRANFEPDLTMIYCNATQLRHLLFSLMYTNGYRVSSMLDPIGSCVHSVVPSLLTGDCKVTVPDPGDYGRAMAGDDEMILTVPTSKIQELMNGLYFYEKANMGYRSYNYLMQTDFQQPPFYQEYFKKWGLDAPKSRAKG